MERQGATVDEALANIRGTIELYLETLFDEERSTVLSQEILTTSIEVRPHFADCNKQLNDPETRWGRRFTAEGERLRHVHGRKQIVIEYPEHGCVDLKIIELHKQDSDRFPDEWLESERRHEKSIRGYKT